MTIIEPSGQLLALIREHALAYKRKASAPSEPHETEVAEEQLGKTSTNAQDWLAQVTQSVVAIKRDDPQRQRKAFRVYLQAVLAREFGFRRTEDQGFQDLVDRVQETMEADDQLQQAMKSAGDMLLQEVKGVRP